MPLPGGLGGRGWPNPYEEAARLLAEILGAAPGGRHPSQMPGLTMQPGHSMPKPDEEPTTFKRGGMFTPPPRQLGPPIGGQVASEGDPGRSRLGGGVSYFGPSEASGPYIRGQQGWDTPGGWIGPFLWGGPM